MSNNGAKKTAVNIKNTTIFAMTDEEQETYSTTPLDLSDRARSFTDSPTTNSTELWGDGELQEIAYSGGTGTLTLALNFLTDTDRQTIFGETVKNGSNIVTGDEVPPTVCVAFKTECTKDGKIVNLYKYFAVTFPPNEETVAQIEGNSVNYSTIQIQGNYRKNHTLGMVKAFKRHVDTSTDEGKALVENWFKTAAFIGNE